MYICVHCGNYRDCVRNKKPMKVAIIGAGAAGCFCAINLKHMAPQVQVDIFEAGAKALAKLAITGGGRCNLTNSFENISDLRQAYPRGAQLMKRALAHFDQNDCRNWFEQAGVPLVLQEDACVFPASQDAMEIVHTLMREMRFSGISLHCKMRISSLERLAQGGYRLRSGGEEFISDAVVVASGGSPKASGQDFLKALSLKMTPPVPSLFSFNIADKELKTLMGTAIRDTETALAGTKFEAKGPLLITHWGLSGPAVLKLSSYAARELAKSNYRGKIIINWLPGDYADDKIHGILKNNPQKLLSRVHPEEIPLRLWTMLLKRASIRDEIRCAELGSKGLNRLKETLHRDSYEISGKGAYKEEFVTCGGVALENISISTLEAREHPKLYFAGEALDVDAITGGFNLQAAWSMGYMTAENISKICINTCL